MLSNNSQPQSKVNSSYAMASRSFAYGTAVGVESILFDRRTRRQSLKDILSFLFGEYVSGIFFITMLTLYMFIKPGAAFSLTASVRNIARVAIKKSLDILVASVGLILAFPIFIIVPVLIKLDSRGPVFYTQERIGLNRRRRSRRAYPARMSAERRGRDRRRDDNHGRPFRVIKFRTMVNNAEGRSGPVWATRNDARVTKLGRFLRKTRLDEVPQLINVLRGEMSMVGPRPERPVFVRDLSTRVPDYVHRLKVKPGITGQAQVTTGYDTSLESVVVKVENDVKYINNWTIFSDVKILLKTVLVVITGKGAC